MFGHQCCITHTETHILRANVNSGIGSERECPVIWKAAAFTKKLVSNILCRAALVPWLISSLPSPSPWLQNDPARNLKLMHLKGTIFYFPQNPSRTLDPVWWWGWGQTRAMPSLIPYEQRLLALMVQQTFRLMHLSAFALPLEFMCSSLYYQQVGWCFDFLSLMRASGHMQMAIQLLGEGKSPSSGLDCSAIKDNLDYLENIIWQATGLFLTHHIIP